LLRVSTGLSKNTYSKCTDSLQFKLGGLRNSFCNALEQPANSSQTIIPSHFLKMIPLSQNFNGWREVCITKESKIKSHNIAMILIMFQDQAQAQQEHTLCLFGHLTL
jgi:hypothetical protein